MIGLMLIAVGQGGIKPCVSAHVGDQFGASNQHLLTKVFGWFLLRDQSWRLQLNADYSLAAGARKSGARPWLLGCRAS